MEYQDKEVYFFDYCGLCKHENNKEIEDPCRYCLDEPVNQNSHKPVNFEPKE